MVLQSSDLVSSVGAIKELQNNNAWKDVLALLRDRIQLLREQMDEESEILSIRLIQGEILALKNFTKSPDTLIHYLQLDELHLEEKNKNGRRNQKGN